MCGLAGIFNYATERPVDVETLRRMTRALVHRGPDDEGFFVDGPIGLGHRRLSIVDLSPTGHQPMATPDGGAWIAYNGEFYNHARFRRDLETRGVRFRGTSDTETLLHLVRERGPEALRDASGIFAFALWDAKKRELLLVRDMLGVKQLYFHDDGKRIVFASEIKALLECADVPRAVDPAAVNEYLHFHTALFDRTFFRDVKQLRAAQWLRVGRGGSRNGTYWGVDDLAPRAGTPDENVRALRSELEQVVSDQLLSDVPVGAFFSGGIDSSAVAAFAKRIGRTPRCFGAHFHEPGVVDERPYQEAAARSIGVHLDIVTVDGSHFEQDFQRALYFQDAPVIGSAMIPMFAVSRLASQHVKVCLGGQAADEVFGGYARYALSHPLQVATSWIAGRMRRTKGASGGPSSGGGNLWKQLLDVRNARRLAESARHLLDWRTRYFTHFATVRESAWRDLFASPDFVSSSNARALFDQTIDRSNASDPATRLMHWEMQTYLTGLFQQDDRMSMANSLESRVPLADPRLVRFALQSPFDQKFRDGSTKWLLREAVKDVLPRDVLVRRKVGFDTPAPRWFRGSHRGFLRDLLLSDRARGRGFFDVRAVERLLDHPDEPYWFDRVWKLACIEMWATVFLDRRVPSGIAPRKPVHNSEAIQRPAVIT